jgi:formylglycine-generating enzyme required for sulfatase activity
MSNSLVCQANCDYHPQPCVDWCDAHAFCKAVGKRLCGKIGGGAAPMPDATTLAVNQWYAACTSNGTYNFPYGISYDETACNTEVSSPQPVRTKLNCQSRVTGYGGVYDLSGNVWEWEDTCQDTSPTAQCRTRGGGAGSASIFMSCDSLTFLARNTYDTTTGFRCCAD